MTSARAACARGVPSSVGSLSARLRSPLIRRGGGGVARWVGTFMVARASRSPLKTSRPVTYEAASVAPPQETYPRKQEGSP
jgi:hypothetical protein